MDIILGIDPGSRITGYGLIALDGQKMQYVDSGCIRLKESSLDQKLKTLNGCLNEVVGQYQPSEAAIEQVFMHINPGGALKLGQARGAAIVSIAAHNVPVAEYSAKQIKQAVVGYGSADKSQVQQMVRVLLNLDGSPQADAADALAVAICHVNTRTNLSKLGGKEGIRYGRVR